MRFLSEQKGWGNKALILVEGEDYVDLVNALAVPRHKRLQVLRNEEGRIAEGTHNAEHPWTVSDKLLKQVDAIENLETHRFDHIKRELEDSEFVVTGEKKVTNKTDGLGGEFTFATLGGPLDLDKILTGEALPEYQSIGAWLFHTATGESLATAKVRKSSWYLGESSAYYVWLKAGPRFPEIIQGGFNP